MTTTDDQLVAIPRDRRPTCKCGARGQIEVKLITSDKFTCVDCVNKRKLKEAS